MGYIVLLRTLKDKAEAQAGLIGRFLLNPSLMGCNPDCAYSDVFPDSLFVPDVLRT